MWALGPRVAAAKQHLIKHGLHVAADVAPTAALKKPARQGVHTAAPGPL